MREGKAGGEWKEEGKVGTHILRNSPSPTPQKIHMPKDGLGSLAALARRMPDGDDEERGVFGVVAFDEGEAAGGEEAFGGGVLGGKV